MFIDDERFPPSSGDRSWIVVRNLDEVTLCITQHGMPMFISFDHDLGEIGHTGFDIAKFIIECDLDQRPGFCIPEDFTFYSHSQNPIGKENIEGLLNNYLAVKQKRLDK